MIIQQREIPKDVLWRINVEKLIKRKIIIKERGIKNKNSNKCK